jgi:ABC-type sugar transport system ATPase subunit
MAGAPSSHPDRRRAHARRRRRLKADVYRILRDLAAGGMAILVVSSDLPEVLAFAHRIVVMADFRTVGVLDAADATEIGILNLASPEASVRGAA